MSDGHSLLGQGLIHGSENSISPKEEDERASERTEGEKLKSTLLPSARGEWGRKAGKGHKRPVNAVNTGRAELETSSDARNLSLPFL